MCIIVSRETNFIIFTFNNKEIIKYFKITTMKNNIKIFFALLILGTLITQSCSATKKDCRGKTKHRLSNGIYM